MKAKIVACTEELAEFRCSSSEENIGELWLTVDSDFVAPAGSRADNVKTREYELLKALKDSLN